MATDLVSRPFAHPAAKSARSRSRRFASPLTLTSWLLALVLAYFVVYPLLQAFLGLFGITSLSGEGGPLDYLLSGETLEALWNTAVLVACGGTLAIFIGAAFAWLNERTDARIGWLAEILPLVSMFVPSLAAAIGWVFLADPEVGLLNGLLRSVLGLIGVELVQGPFNIYSWYGLIWCYTVFLVPFAYLAISNGLQSLDPSLEEASRMSGASPLKTFWRVSLPSLKPALGGAVMLVIVMGIALYSMPVIIGTRAGIDVLPVLIVHDVTQSYPVNEISALSRSSILLTIVLIALYLQRRMVGYGRAEAFATIGGKGARAGVIRLGRMRRPAKIIMVGYLMAAAVVPLLGLVGVSLQPFWSASYNWSALTLDAYRTMFDRPILREGLLNSLTLASSCATVAVVCAVLITHFTEVKGGRIARAIDGVLKTPAAIPHIVFAIALIAAFGGPPWGWTGTPLILIAAYIIMYFPQAALYTTAAIQQVGRPLIEASNVSGAGDGKTLRRVLLPLMLPGVISGWALIFVLMSGDITASAMLATTRTPVAGFVMLDQWGHGSYPTLAALGVTLTVTSTLVVLIALRFRARFRIRR